MVQTQCPYYNPIPTIGKSFKNLTLCRTWKKNICANCFYDPFNNWPNLIFWGKNIMSVAHNCNNMDGSKGQSDETACPPYSLMAVMELREGNKWRHKHRRNRHDCGNPLISKVESLARNWGLQKQLEIFQKRRAW